MSGSAWAALAAAANSVGGSLQKNAEDERQLKLKKLELDAQQKRDEFLTRMRQQLSDESDEKKHERESGDVASTFTDPETGNVLGRTKGGKTIPLSETSQEYKDALAETKRGKILKDQADLENAQWQPRMNAARLEEIQSSTEKNRREKPVSDKDAMADKIRSDYMRLYESIEKSGSADVLDDRGKVDPLKIADQVKSQLYPVYGGENVNASLGSQAGAGRTARPGTPQQAPPQQTSPSQPNAPSVEVLMQQANAAVKAGADPAKVEARLKEAMAKFGYVQ